MTLLLSAFFDDDVFVDMIIQFYLVTLHLDRFRLEKIRKPQGSHKAHGVCADHIHGHEAHRGYREQHRTERTESCRKKRHIQPAGSGFRFQEAHG